MQTLKKFIKKNIQDNRIYLLILLIVVIAAYALQLTRMGFYWDDWQVVYLAHPGTPADFWNYFLFDRPFSAWTYILTMPVLGTSALAWQVFTILMRWAAALGFVWTLTSLWPERRRQVFWMGIFFTVYPGFLQQPISAAFSQHFITYALFNFSLAFSLQALLHPNKRVLFTVLACFFSLVQILTMEYFFGLEFLRPLLIFLLLNRLEPQDKTGKRIFKTFKTWLPYLLVLTIFAAWRFGYYPSISPENSPTLLQDFKASPLHALVQFAQYVLQDVLQISFSAWANALQPAMIIDKSLWVFTAAAVFAFLAGAWFYASSRQETEMGGKISYHFSLEAVGIGLLSILLGGLPVWSTNRQVIVGLWSDRFTLAPFFGAAILLVALIDWLVQVKNRQTIVFSLVLFASLVTQMLNTAKYADNWDIQRSYYWQLFWRAPALEAGTALIGPKLPMSYVSDYAVSYALNAMYDSGRITEKPQYWFLIGPRAKGANFSAYEPGLPIEYTLRDVTFSGSTSNSLGVSFAAGRTCLRVLDPAYYDFPTRLGDDLGGIERDMYPVSNTARIKDYPSASLPAGIFGPEPRDEWCYYYEKADLARQLKDWKKIVQLADAAEAAGLRTKEGPELLPFIEAYAQLGQWDKAVEVTRRANVLTAMMQPGLCSTWQRILDETPTSDARARAVFDVQDFLNCPEPIK